MPPHPALAPLRKLILTIALYTSSPFWMLTFLFFLLQKPLAWLLTTAALGTLILALGGVAWLVVRAKLRPVVELLAPADTLHETPPR